MAIHGLRPVDFSLLCLIHHNPGITSRRLSEALSIQPPNLVGKIADLETKGLISRTVQTADRRALGLTLTENGRVLVCRAEITAADLEQDASAQLSSNERDTLISLLKKVYLPAE